MVQSADDRDPGSLVEIFGGYFCEFLETNYLDPSGLLPGEMKGERKQSDWITFR
jgi:hypothetical protein